MRCFSFTECSQDNLLLAVMLDNVSLVSEMLRRPTRPDLEEKDERGRTALSLAAAENSSPMVKLLLEHKSVAGAADKDQQTPLMEAARRSLPMCQLLVEHRAGVNVGCPLFEAAERGNDEIVRFLLASKADPNQHVPEPVHSRGADRPLNTLCEMMAPSLSCIKLLLEARADVRFTYHGRSVMHAALENPFPALRGGNEEAARLPEVVAVLAQVQYFAVSACDFFCRRVCPWPRKQETSTEWRSSWERNRAAIVKTQQTAKSVLLAFLQTWMKRYPMVQRL